MLIAGVIDHQIHNDLHIPGMGTLQNGFESFHTAKLGSDIHVIGNIVAAIRTGGGIDGGKPDAVTA